MSALCVVRLFVYDELEPEIDMKRNLDIAKYVLFRLCQMIHVRNLTYKS